jgi:hypothetical protein
MAFENHWMEVVRQADAEVFELDELRKRVLADLIEVSGEDPAWLRASLSAAMGGKPLPERPGERSLDLKSTEAASRVLNPPIDPRRVPIDQGTEPRQNPRGGGGEGERDPSPTSERVAGPVAIGEGAQVLRAKAFQLAATLAQRHHFGELIEPLHSQGCGFIVTDVVDPSLHEKLGKETYERISTLWWHLLGCAELTAIPAAQATRLLPAESVLRRALEIGDLDLVLDHVATLG